MSTFKQLPLTVDQQIELLKQKKLIIEDHDIASYWLSHVSYYRLKHYTFTFRNIEDDHNFIPNTTFNQVIALYLFDRELKLIIFDGLETIEVAIKTMLSIHCLKLLVLIGIWMKDCFLKNLNTENL